MQSRFALLLAGGAAAGLGALWLAAPGRTDWLAAAAVGAGFGVIAAVAGHDAVRRAAAGSAEKGVQAFLAVMTAKVLAFAAFLLTIATTTSLNLAALAAGLAGVTLSGEILLIGSLRRSGGGLGARGGGRGPDSHRDQGRE